MARRFVPMSLVMGLVLAAHGAFSAPYYEGKTVRLTLGFSAGGDSTSGRGLSRAIWGGIFPEAPW